MLTASSTLAIFTMFGLSSFALFWAKRVHLPHTVFLVLLGIVLGFLSQIETFSFFSEFHLTPELLFYLLLPTLIFESAYSMSARRLVEDSVIVMILSTISLLISAAAIAGLLYVILPLFGLSVPFIFLFLFGSLISATDPVAVLALFKEYGAPRRLSLIFEGESLFNDATAVALFLVVLDIMLHGYHGFNTLVEGTLSFTVMILGGIVFGVLIGGIFVRLIGLTRENEIASITLTIVLAHTTFILSEVISHHLTIGSHEFHLSSIIATTVASLLMGNYGRAKIHPRAEEFVEKLWSLFAFMANSLVFILIGVLLTTVPITSTTMLIITFTTVLVVAFSRALSIYPVVELFNRVVPTDLRVPVSWQHLLSWGSLRGALAVTMVLLVPDTFALSGWSLDVTPKEFLLALTIGCIFATLFIKAPSIKYFMRKLKLDTLTTVEEVEYQEARALLSHEITARMKRYVERGYVSRDTADRIITDYAKGYEDACAELRSKTDMEKSQLARRVLRMFAIGTERHHLKRLYHHHEVSERVYRKLTGKLRLQFEAIEHGNLESNMSMYTDGKDVFEWMANAIHRIIRPTTVEEHIKDQYMYYRAQTILARKVLKELRSIEPNSAENIFTSDALDHVTSLYTNFVTQSSEKMRLVSVSHPQICNALGDALATCGVAKIREDLLREMFERELITPKLYITLNDEPIGSPS